MKKKSMYHVLAATGGGLIGAGLAVATGLGLGSIWPSFHARPLLGLLVVALIVASLANRIAAKVYARNHFGMPAEERQALFDRHAEACRKDPEAVLRQFSDMEAVPIFMLVLYFLLTFAIGVTAGMAGRGADSFVEILEIVVVGFVCAHLLYMPLLRLLLLVPRKLNKEALTPVSLLPTLQAMAVQAAKDVGLNGTVRLEITRDCECEVNRIGRTYVVFLGTRLLSVLTQAEMEQAMRIAMDFFHHPKENRRVLRRYRLGMLGSADLRGETFAFDLFFSYADAYLEWEYELYTQALTRYLENCSLQRIRQDGDPRAALNGLAKRDFWRYFVFEYTRHISANFYKEDTPPRHFEEGVCQAFRTACTQRSGTWMDMLERQLHTAGDKHYLFREKRDFLNPDNAFSIRPLDLPEYDTPYGQDVLKAIREVADAELYRISSTTYAKDREREYAEPLRNVEAYEKAPEGYSTPELSPVINGYRDLGRIDEAESLCDAIMARETNPFALAHAIYFKGMCMIHRYETEGVDLIYRAIDLNKNYMHDGFELVEEYCTLCGLTDEYETFRRRAEIQISAHAYNHEGAGYLLPTDRLEREEELGDMLPDILGYMEQVADGCIRQVYLVRKVVSEDFFTSAFVVNFEYGIPEEQLRRVYAAIFNYLDAYPVDWQFSLFVYDRQTELAVHRVKGSLVWEKKQ